MTINEQIKELYAEYADLFGGEQLAVDGVVDEETFVASKYRVMALLKEAHDKDKVIPDWNKYVDYICEEAKTDRKYAHWDNLNYWIEALYNPEKSFAECTNHTYGYNKELNINMLKVAVVNVKKTLGDSKSDDDEILEYAKKNREMLLKEISLIKPRLVICGGTFKSAKEIYQIKTCQHLECGLEYFVINDGNDKMIFIDYVHPSYFGVGKCILYTFIKVAFSEAREVMIKEKIIS